MTDVLEAIVNMPLKGAWKATLLLDGDDSAVPQQQLFVRLEGLEFVGTPLDPPKRDGGQIRAILWGGAGGMRKELPARSYLAPSVRTVLNAILSEAGETLSDTVESALLDQKLAGYVRAKGLTVEAIDQLADDLGVSWRVLRDGTVWLGTETWPTVEIDEDVTTLEAETEDGARYHADKPDLLPGIVIDGQRIKAVVHHISSNKVTTHTHYGDVQQSEKVRNCRNTKIAYARHYPATVISQRGDGTLELKPEHPAIAGTGLDKIPLWVGVPGLTVELAAGTRVLVGFHEGRPSKPYAHLFEASGSGLTKLTIKATGSVVVDAPSVELGGDSALAIAERIESAFNSHTHAETGVTTNPPKVPMSGTGADAAKG